MKNHKKIKKAVITAAGYDTRFLPASKNQPKVMFPLVDKPAILYLVEEAVNSGIEDIIIVTRHGQHSIEDFFDNYVELERSLEDTGKEDRLEQIREITKMANFVYVRQKKHLPYGNGTPLLTVKSLIDDDESFVYIFGDDMTISKTPVTKQLIDAHEKSQPSAIIAVQEIPLEETYRYGVLECEERDGDKYRVKNILEKVKDAPSNLAQFGRFIFDYEAIEEAKKTPEGADNELWIADVVNGLIKKDKKVLALPIEGEWLTTGDPLRYMKTNIKFALQREEYADELREFMKTL